MYFYLDKLMQKFLLTCVMIITAAFSLPSVADDVKSAQSVFAKSHYKADFVLAQVKQVKQYKAKVKYKIRKKTVKKRNHRRVVKRSKRRASVRRVSRIINQDLYNPRGPLKLKSTKAIVINQLTGETVYAKNSTIKTPIASLTKLMTAMVVLDSQLPVNEYMSISHDDVDSLKGTRSRLAIGTRLPRGKLLQLALMSSENRAAAALSRYYPGGRPAFIRAMNTKAVMLGMKDTYFVDSTGLDSHNVSTAIDLVKLVTAAHQYDEIRQITTTPSQAVYINGKRRPLNYVNTNALVRNGRRQWDIGLSKTGFINEAGRCLVMQADIAGQPMIIVLLDSSGKYTRLGDANRIRKWYEFNHQQRQARMVTRDASG